MYLILLWYEVDDLLWTSAYASSASYAVDSVDYSYAVYYIDGVELASVMAVTKPDASEHAGVRRSEPALCALAGLHALPLEKCAGRVACTVAHDLGYLRLCVSYSSSEKLGDLCRDSSAARRAKCAGEFAVFGELCRVIIAAGESASTAVSARKALSYQSCGFVHCNVEHLGSEDQEPCAYKSDHCYQQYSCYYTTTHIFTSFLLEHSCKAHE